MSVIMILFGFYANILLGRIVKKLEEEKTRNMRTTMEAVEKLDR